ncbi:MAG: hypothetical protein GY847_34490 [Proteobacteria bacterium]|nr:hypothetical protein [Pseudomonadota bacterium]
MADLDVDVKIKSSSKVGVKGIAGAEHVHINVDPVTIQKVDDIEPLDISSINNIAPVATHIKEVNHIDPVTIEPMKIRGIDNIEPLKVEKFNITNLPTMNISLRQLPAVNMDLRRVPPLSLGFHQDFHLPSNYMLRFRFFGIEFLRMNMDGETVLFPVEKARREQENRRHRSQPTAAIAGNPAIPSIMTDKTTGCVTPSTLGTQSVCGGSVSHGTGGLRAGLPQTCVPMPERSHTLRVSSVGSVRR